MTVIEQAWARAKALKDLLAGTHEEGMTVKDTADAGERWVRGLFAQWQLHGEEEIDAAADVQLEIAEQTSGNLWKWRDELDGSTVIASMHASGFSNGLALGLEIARQQLQSMTDPRDLGGDIAGPGGPFDHGQTVLDASKAIVADELEIAKVDPERGARGQEAFALLIEGRINQTQDRAKVMLFGDLDWLAALITECHGVAERDGQARRLHALCDARWKEMPHP